MKAKYLFASAVFAAALPLGSVMASSNATTLGGPQGTGAYGVVDPLDINHDGVISAEERAAAVGGATTAPAGMAAYDLNRDGVISQDELAAANDARARRGAFSGPSWATNPPVPAQ